MKKPPQQRRISANASRAHHKGRTPSWLIGLAVVVLAAVAMALAAGVRPPWSGGYELRAVFAQVQGMTNGTPVRIAGVDVGEVTAIEHLGGDPSSRKVLVTMEISEEGLPIRTDAQLKIRPRLFLEGNYFIDLQPGSPSAPEADDGHTVSLAATSAPVQLDQVLTTLQSDVRANLRVALSQLSRALVDDGGARGLRRLARASGGAYKPTARVAQALLGTERHDLSNLLRNLGRVVAALGRDEPALQGLVTNLRISTGALAAEAQALERSIAELPATLALGRRVLGELSGSLPAARAFAREALPGVVALPSAIDAATPLLTQLRGLLSRAELRGAAAGLRSTVPKLVRLGEATLPVLRELRGVGSCFNEVLVPWANSTVPDPETPATGRIFEETSYGLVGIAGESRSADSNGPYARVLGGTGGNFVVFPPFEGTTDEVVGVSPLPLLGARPAIDSAAKTPFRPDVPCETQEPPDLDAGDAARLPDQSPLAQPSIEADGVLRERLARIAAQMKRPDSQAQALAELNRLLTRELGWQELVALAEEGGR